MLGLRQVAWKTVQNEALAGIGTGQTLADDAEHDLIGHQLTGVHHRLGGLAQRGAGRHGFAQQVSGGYLGNAVMLRQPLSLSALPTARRSQQNNPHSPFTLAVSLIFIEFIS